MFQFEVKRFLDALSKIEKAAGSGNTVNIRCTEDKQIFLSSRTEEGASIRAVFPANEVEKAFSFQADLAVVKDICAGRAAQVFSFSQNSESEIGFTQIKARYKGKFQARPYEKIEPVPKAVKENKSQIPGVVKEALFRALPYVNVAATFGTALTAKIRVSKSKLTIVVGDFYQLALFQEKLSHADGVKLDFEIPMTYFDAMKTYVAGDPTDMFLATDESRIYVWTDFVQLALPMVASETIFSLDEMITQFVSTEHKTNTRVTIKASSLHQATSSVKAVYEDDSAIIIKPLREKERLEVKLTTNYGESQDAIKMKTHVTDGKSINLPPHVIDDAISRYSGEVDLQIVDGQKLLFIKAPVGKYGDILTVVSPYDDKGKDFEKAKVNEAEDAPKKKKAKVDD